MIFYMLGLFLLVMISSFISGSETAITGVSRAKIHSMVKVKNTQAKHVQYLQNNLSNSISTILVANQAINFIIPIIAHEVATDYLSPLYGNIFTIFIGIFLIVYAEIFPKIVAVKYAYEYSIIVAMPIKLMITILKPIVKVLELIAKCTLKLFGIDANKEIEHDAEAEVRGAIELHMHKKDEERFMLTSILDLGELTVHDIMTHRKNLYSIESSLSIDEISQKLVECKHSTVPIWKENRENIIGVIKTKEYFKVINNNKISNEQKTLGSMINQPWFIPETTKLIDQLQEFRKRREYFALVVDEYGDLLGVITLKDILEEIVGEMVDKYDKSFTDIIKKQTDGSILAHGSAAIRDINKQFDLNFTEEDDYTTIAGLIMHRAQKIPDIGQTYVINDCKIEIVKRQKNQISLVKITIMNEGAKGDD